MNDYSPAGNRIAQDFPRLPRSARNNSLRKAAVVPTIWESRREEVKKIDPRAFFV